MRLSELHKGDQWRERGYRTGKFPSVLSSFLLSSLPGTEFSRSLAIAAGFLRRHKTKVTTYEKLRLIRGIGDSIANKIVEIVQTGEVSLLFYYQGVLRTFSRYTGSHRKLENELPQEKAARLLSGIYGSRHTFSPLPLLLSD